MTAIQKTLDQLANEIETNARWGDEHLLETAILVRELKLRIEAGEAGNGVKWTEWAQTRFGRGKTWLYELNAIASAKDPKAALAHYRKKNSERQKLFNERLVEQDPERCEVIKLIRKMDINHVRKVRKYLCDLIGK